jgi:hypothetical protein
MADTHLTLTCEDVAAGARFFRDVLALPIQGKATIRRTSNQEQSWQH